MDFAQSQTCEALMRAFAGECQAHTRYLLAAKSAAARQLHVLRQAFEFTAKQELIHAQLFAQRLQQQGITKIRVSAGYPLDPADDLQQILTQAAQHETHEAQEIYLQHADSCANENNTAEAALFRAIAKIEQSHAERFSLLAQLMQDGALFRSGEQTVWMCLNCGHLHTGTEPPQRCPVCGEAQGFAVREQLAPFTLRQGEPLQ